MQKIGENYLDQFQEGSKLTKEKWEELSQQPASIFADTFPFFDDPKFVKMKAQHQRFLLAYTLKDTYGFTYEQCYRFAARNYITNSSNAKASANHFKNVIDVKYFIEKLDWMRLESLGYSASKIIEAEAGLSYSDITEYLDDDGCFCGKSLKELPEKVRRAIKSFEVLEHFDKQGNKVKKFRIQLWDKGASLQRMQKMKGMQTDVVKSSSEMTMITGEMSAQDAAKAYQEMMKG